MYLYINIVLYHIRIFPIPVAKLLVLRSSMLEQPPPRTQKKTPWNPRPPRLGHGHGVAEKQLELLGPT